MLMSVLSSKVKLKASLDFNLSFKISLILSERSFILHETVKQERVICSTKCLYSGHAYSVNIVKQFLINSPSVKGFPFFAIHSQNLKLSFVTSFEFFLYVVKILCCFLKEFFICSILSIHAWPTILSNWKECLVVQWWLILYSLITAIVFSQTRQITPWLWGITKYFVHHSLLNTLPSQSIFRFLAVDFLLALKSTQKYFPQN